VKHVMIKGSINVYLVMSLMKTDYVKTLKKN
jgi:hypothetical protein